MELFIGGLQEYTGTELLAVFFVIALMFSMGLAYLLDVFGLLKQRFGKVMEKDYDAYWAKEEYRRGNSE